MSHEMPAAAAAGVLLAGRDAQAVDSLQTAADVLGEFGIRSRTAIISSGEVGGRLMENVCAVIVASPDAVLPSSLASTSALPVIRVPTMDGDLRGLTLLDDGGGNLPAGAKGSEFATMAIGEAGARNAALFVVSLLAVRDDRLHEAWRQFRERQTEAVLRHPPLSLEN